MENIQYYEFSNEYDETYYAYGTEEELARFLSWLEGISNTPFVMDYAKPEDLDNCLCMEDVLP